MLVNVCQTTGCKIIQKVSTLKRVRPRFLEALRPKEEVSKDLFEFSILFRSFTAPHADVNPVCG
jgi:hypothetical protein